MRSVITLLNSTDLRDRPAGKVSCPPGARCIQGHWTEFAVDRSLRRDRTTCSKSVGGRRGLPAGTVGRSRRG